MHRGGDVPLPAFDDVQLPAFDENGNLPQGVYRLAIEEIALRFTWTVKRKSLFEGLRRAIESLAQAGVKQVWIDGSFVTAKDEPSDVDGCWDYESSVDADKLDPVFLDTDPPRTQMKEKYGVDFLISGARLMDPDAEGCTVQ